MKLIKFSSLFILLIFTILSFFYKDLLGISFVKNIYSFDRFSSLDNLSAKQNIIITFMKENNDKNLLKRDIFNKIQVKSEAPELEEDIPLPDQKELDSLLIELKEENHDENMTMKIQMIIFEDQTVVINNKLLKKGDKLYNFTINTIEKDKVCLSKEKETKCLNIFH